MVVAVTQWKSNKKKKALRGPLGWLRKATGEPLELASTFCAPCRRSRRPSQWESLSSYGLHAGACGFPSHLASNYALANLDGPMICASAADEGSQPSIDAIPQIPFSANITMIEPTADI
jgi:hypothetical protein